MLKIINKFFEDNDYNSKNIFDKIKIKFLDRLNCRTSFDKTEESHNDEVEFAETLEISNEDLQNIIEAKHIFSFAQKLTIRGNVIFLNKDFMKFFPNVEYLNFLARDLSFLPNLICNANNLKNIRISSEILTLGSETIVNCQKLETVRIFAEKCQVYPGSFLSNCPNINTCNITSSLFFARKKSFLSCSARTINITAKALKIDDGAFNTSCAKKINLKGSSIKLQDAFDYCPNLTAFKVQGNIIEMSELMLEHCDKLQAIECNKDKKFTWDYEKEYESFVSAFDNAETDNKSINSSNEDATVNTYLKK